jgi:hypothetical protein
MNDEFFVISRISREDLKSQGWDADNIDDSTMQSIADKIGDMFCGSGYWNILNDVAKNYELKKL